MEPRFVAGLIKEFGNRRIVVAVEIKNNRIAYSGWQKTANKDYLQFARELKVLGVREILFTDVSKDGSLTEPNFEAIQNLIELGFNVTASGGICNGQSIKRLKLSGAYAVILGKALYENKITLADAQSAANPSSNLAKRIIPCLDVKDGKVVKGVKFENHVVMGDVVEFARRYCDEGADELVFYDITASTQTGPCRLIG